MNPQSNKLNNTKQYTRHLTTLVQTETYQHIFDWLLWNKVQTFMVLASRWWLMICFHTCIASRKFSNPNIWISRSYCRLVRCCCRYLQLHVLLTPTHQQMPLRMSALPPARFPQTPLISVDDNASDIDSLTSCATCVWTRWRQLSF